MRRLSSDIRGGKFHDVEMIRDRTGQGLMDAMAFKKYFAFAVYNVLEYRFEDNHIMTTFKVLGPPHMPSTQVGLANSRWLNWSCYMTNMKLSMKLEEEKSPH